MMKKGFGVGTIIVIIALVLIIGGYLYYSRQAAPAEPEEAEVMGETILPGFNDADATMEDGTAAEDGEPVDAPAATGETSATTAQ